MAGWSANGSHTTGVTAPLADVVRTRVPVPSYAYRSSTLPKAASSTVGEIAFVAPEKAVTGTTPMPGGAVAVAFVVVVDWTGTWTVPNATSVTPPRFQPLTDITSPPPGRIVSLDSEERIGVVVYVYRSDVEAADVPSGVVTSTSTVEVPAGAVTLSDVLDTTVSPVPVFVPKRTFVAPVRRLPVTVICWPPLAGPVVRDSDVTVGRRKVTWSLGI